MVPALSLIRDRISYDPLTGVFLWLKDQRGPAKAGDVAGCCKQGRWKVKICQNAIEAGRLAWYMHYGVLPAGEVDHIDGNPLNNRIVNLRDVTHAQNAKNIKAHGVRFEANRGKWLARICCDKKQMNLGRYDTEEQARAVYEAAKILYFGEFARAPI